MKIRERNKPRAAHKLLSAALVAGILIGFTWLSVALVGIQLDFSTLLQYKVRFWQGFVMTIELSVASLMISLFIGLITALLQRSKVLVVSYLCKTYIQIIRGTPLLVQIYFFTTSLAPHGALITAFSPVF